MAGTVMQVTVLVFLLQPETRQARARQEGPIGQNCLYIYDKRAGSAVIRSRTDDSRTGPLPCLLCLLCPILFSALLQDPCGLPFLKV